MDGPGFHVEIDVLEAASRSMDEIVADQDNAELRDLCGGQAVYGHEWVHAEFAEFCAAWSVGLDALCDRARNMGYELGEAARTYREVDDEAARQLTEDPAADVVDPPNFEPRGHP